MDNLSSALTVLSAMITPAVLILASGSLSMTTSQRLSRSIDRVRNLAEQLNNLSKSPETAANKDPERNFLIEELMLAARRNKFMQHAMTSLYLALTLFVASILTIGLLEILGLKLAWLLLLLGFSGVVLLFYACIMLILESRLALQSVSKEMHFTLTRYLQGN